MCSLYLDASTDAEMGVGDAEMGVRDESDSSHESDSSPVDRAAFR